MNEFEEAVMCLPTVWSTMLSKLPPYIQEDVHEIRLRENEPLLLSTSDGDLFLTKNGQITQLPMPDLLICTHAQIEGCFLHLCNYSIHTHQQEILQGYISTQNGLRVGIAGRAVMEKNEMVSMQHITSLCVRVHRSHCGCANDLLPHLFRDGRLRSALICGEPSSGKTSLLRDLARQLSMGYNKRRYRVTVVDERGELSARNRLRGCDVLLHFPKAQGIVQGVRCLAPDVVVFDELSDMAEANSVLDGLNCGVKSLSTAHGGSIREVLRRPPIFHVLRQGGFERIVILSGRDQPGKIAEILDWEDVWNENRRVIVAGGSRYRNRGLSVGKNTTPSCDLAVV